MAGTGTGTPGPTLADMPREIKQEIIKGLDPLDLAAISKTSRDLHSLMADDWLLCKSVYSQYLVSRTSNGQLSEGRC